MPPRCAAAACTHRRRHLTAPFPASPRADASLAGAPPASPRHEAFTGVTPLSPLALAPCVSHRRHLLSQPRPGTTQGFSSHENLTSGHDDYDRRDGHIAAAGTVAGRTADAEASSSWRPDRTARTSRTRWQRRCSRAHRRRGLEATADESHAAPRGGCARS